MNLVTLDFETYFDRGYSLSKMTMEAYIRDPRFKVHCAGLQFEQAQEALTDEYFKKAGPGWWSKIAVLCHHAHFDGLILSHHYDARPAFWFDTLSMARLVLPHLESHSLDALAKHFGLPAKTVPYNEFKGVRNLPPDLYNKLAEGCKHDVSLTYAIFTKLLPSVPQDELRVIDATVRMFTEPCLVLDRPRMEAYLESVQSAKAETLLALNVSRADLQSSAKLTALLAARGVAAPTKPSPSASGRRIPAFGKNDAGMKQLLEHGDETVAALAAARLGEKSTLGETRAERLLDMSSRGPLPVYLNYCGAHTTRWSGGDSVNWQNFTRGSEIRKSVMAPAGHKLVIIDLAQIEFRVAMWLAGEKKVLATLAAGQDVYCQAASDFYGRTITKKDKTERMLWKTTLLGAQYGMGATKFTEILRQQGLEGDARQLIRHYRRSYPGIVHLWREGDMVLGWLHEGSADSRDWKCLGIRGKRVYGPNGTYLDYSNLDIGEEGEYVVTRRKTYSDIWGGKLVENVVQYLARIVLSEALIKIAARWRIVMTAHDELVMLAPEDGADLCLAECLQIMKTPPAWANKNSSLGELPLDAEGIISERYSK